MARIRHVALTVHDPAKTARFYMDTFGLTEVRRDPDNKSVVLSDGHVNLTILCWRTGTDIGQRGRPSEYLSKIHHIGFQVEDLDATIAKLEATTASPLTKRPAAGTSHSAGGSRNVEMKWASPDDTVLDISQSGWDGAP